MWVEVPEVWGLFDRSSSLPAMNAVITGDCCSYPSREEIMSTNIETICVKNYLAPSNLSFVIFTLISSGFFFYVCLSLYPSVFSDVGTWEGTQCRSMCLPGRHQVNDPAIKWLMFYSWYKRGLNSAPHPKKINTFCWMAFLPIFKILHETSENTRDVQINSCPNQRSFAKPTVLRRLCK